MYIIHKISLLIIAVITLMHFGAVFKLLSPLYGWVVFSIFILTIIYVCKDIKLTSNIFRNVSLVDKILLSIIAVTFVTSFLRSLAPITGGDSLSCYLEIPKRYINEGGFKILIKNSPFSSMPLGASMLYLLAMLIGPDFLAQTTACFVSFLLFYAVYKFTSVNFDRTTGLVSGCLLLTTIVFHMESFFALTDLLPALFCFCGLWAIWEYGKDNSYRNIIVFAVFCGGALAAKFVSVIPVTVMFIYFIYLLFRESSLPRHKKIKHFLMASSIIFFLFVPWAIKAYHETGNPIYPILSKFFMLKFPYSILQGVQEIHATSKHALFSVVPKNFVGYLLYPILISFIPVATNDNFIGPLFLIFFIFAIRKKFWHIRLLKIIFFLVLAMYSLFFFGIPQVRHIFIVFCLLSVVSSWGLVSFIKDSKQKILKVVIITFVLFYFVGFTSKAIYEKLKAYPVVFGYESASIFHKTYEYGFNYYDDFQFLNKTVKQDEKVLVFTDLTYHLDADFIWAQTMEKGLLDIVQISDTEFLNYMILHNIHYIWFSENEIKKKKYKNIALLVRRLLDSGAPKMIYHNRSQGSYVFKIIRK